MLEVSIIIPQRDAGALLPAQLAHLQSVLTGRRLSHEILVVDDGSGPSTVNKLYSLLARYPQLRVIRSPRRDGLSAALSAGIASATGEVILALEAGPRYSAEAIPELLDNLSHADLAYGRPRTSSWEKNLRRITRLPRWLLLGLDVSDPECMLWAARREAVGRLELGRGMYRYLATLVGMRGWRVCEVSVDVAAAPRPSHDGWPNPGDLLAAWWLRRRFRSLGSQRLEAAKASLDEWGTLSDVPRQSLEQAA